MPIDNSCDRERSIARISLAAALLLAAILQGIIAYRSMVIAKDGVHFIGIAQELSEFPRASMLKEDQHPGFPAMILGAHQFTSRFIKDPVFSWIAAARIVGGVTGLLTLILVWQLSRRLFGGYAAAMAALIFAVQPMFRGNAVDVMSDTPHLFFYLMGAWAACEGLMRKQWAWFPAAGAFSALAYWVRPEGLCVALVTAGLLGIKALFGREKRLQWLVAGIGTLAVAGVLIAPYAILKGGLTSKKQIVPDGFVSIPKVRDHAIRPASPGTSVTSAAAGIAMAMPEPRLLVLRCIEGFRYVLILPLFVGVLLSGGRKAPGDLVRLVLGLVLVHMALLLALSAIAGYISQRHTMVVVALAMPWVGWGTWRTMVWLGRWAPRRDWLAARLGHSGAVLAAGLLVVSPMIPYTARTLHKGNEVFAELGLELRSWASPGDKVLSSLPYTAFYANLAGNASEDIRFADVMEHPSYAKRFRFIVFDRRDKRASEEWMNVLRRTHDKVPVSGRGKSWQDVILLVRRPAFGP
jgi:hypothetical protein